MDRNEVWKILEIEETDDLEAITTAYRTKLVKVNPEDDAEGFMKLREAFEEAVNIVNNQGQPDEEEFDEENATDIERHIHRFKQIYDDIYNRRDNSLIEEWLADPLCTELDTTDEVREQLLAAIMERFMIPHEWWLLFDKTFDIVGCQNALKEIFPPDFISFVVNNIEIEDSFDYSSILPREEMEQMFYDALGEASRADIDCDPEAFDPPEYRIHDDSYVRTITQGRIYLNDIFRIKVDDIRDNIPDGLSEEEIEEYKKNKLEQNKQEADDIMQKLCALINYEEGFSIWEPEETGIKLTILELLGRREEARLIADAVVKDDLTFVAGEYNPFGTYNALRIRLDELMDPQLSFSEEEKAEIISRCEDILSKLEAKVETVYTKYCRSQIQLIYKNYDEANELILDALDLNSNFNQGVILLKKIASCMTEDYYVKLEEGVLNDKEKVELGWALFRLDRTEEIFDLLKQTNVTEENSYGYNNLYARGYFAKGRYEEAIPYLLKWEENLDKMFAKRSAGEQLSHKDEGRVKRSSYCYFLIAFSYSKQNEQEKAIEYYKKAVEVAEREIPDDLNERLYYLENYGRLLHDVGKYDEAMEVWNNMIDMTDHCIPGYVHRQKTAYEARDAQLVIDDYYNIIRDVPNYAPAYELAASVFINFKQYKDAESVLARADQVGIDSDLVEKTRARLYEEQGEKEKAAQIYEKIAQHVEENDTDLEDIEDFYDDIAYFYLNYRDEDGNRIKMKEAETYCKKCEELNPDNLRMLWIKTDVEEILERDPSPVYEYMLDHYPENASVNFEYGEYFNRKKKYQEAEHEYLECLKKDENHRSVNNRLMNLYQDRYGRDEDRKDYTEAVKYATRQLELVDDSYYRIERALLYIDGYEFAKAAEDAKKAIEADPENPYAHNCLGLTKMRSGDYMGAIRDFDMAIKVQEEAKETTAPYNNASRCCEIMHEYGRAIDYLQRMEEAFGGSRSIDENLSRLFTKNKQFKQAEKLLEDLIKYAESRREETRNAWYDEDKIRFMLKKVEVAHLSGNERKAASIMQDILDFLKSKGYLEPNLAKECEGYTRRVSASIFRKIADHYINNERNYKDSILFFEKAISMKMPKGEATTGASLTNGIKKGNFLSKHSKAKVHLDSPEELMTDRAELREMGELYRYFAAACYGYGLKDWAETIAKRAVNCFERAYKAIGGLKAYLDTPDSSPLRYSDFAMVKFFMGETEEAFKLTETCNRLPHCSFCLYDVCYDRVLTEARLYELMGNIDKAIEYYKLARSYSPNDCEIYIALRTLSGSAE